MWCDWSIGSVLEVCDGFVGGEGSGWGGGDGLWNEVGWLGLGVHQSGESKHLGFGVKGSIWGGGSLHFLER
jgi:hypothetical protein